jgi:NADH-quinone oxidoreductase subunit H
MILETVIISLLKIVFVLAVLLLTVAYAVYFERKIAAWVQNRVGPNRVGPLGLLQPFADVLKLLLKEDIVPEKSNKFIHTLAPVIALIVAFSTYAVIPFGPEVTLFGYKVSLVVADVNIGILYVLALTSLGVYGITFAGWSSGSKYSLFGGIRSSAQMISYEVSMGFSVAGVIMLAGSLEPTKIVAYQSGLMWNAFIQPVGFITFLVAAFAETNRMPFDLPEAEPELVGGYHTEYSSMKFASFFLAEYANMIVACGIITTLYLGGWQVPYLDKLNLGDFWTPIIQVVAFFVKIGVLLFFMIWVRWSLPRFRYDQLMSLGWKVMFPLALLNVLWVAFLIMGLKL